MFRTALLVASLASVVAIGEDAEVTGDETCALQIRQNHTKHIADSCTVCNTCGGQWPLKAGRATYYQDHTTEWEGYGEECAGQQRQRTSDGAVIFSPMICCGSSKPQPEPRSSAAQGPGSCALCDECQGSDFPFDSGMLPWVACDGCQERVGQNYERYEGKCTEYYGSTDVNGVKGFGNPPAGKLCCNAHFGSLGTCALCGGSCGGHFPNDRGNLPYPKNTDGSYVAVAFEGYATSCGKSIQRWQANSLSFYPKMCCVS